MEDNGLIVRSVFTVAARAIIQAAVLLGPAGTFLWPRAWVLIGITVIGTSLSFLSLWYRDKDLLRERVSSPIHAGQPLLDRVLLIALIVTIVATLLISSLDVWHFKFLPISHMGFALAGLVMIAFGAWMWVKALRANSFASVAVKHQSVRQHQVIDHGVYAVVRHPMYTGISLVVLGQPLWLGSTLGVLIALVGVFILGLRIVEEEKFLSHSLQGYDDYCQKVRFRLIPGIW